MNAQTQADPVSVRSDDEKSAPDGSGGDCDGKSLRVFYDGGCPLCRREIGFYQGMSGTDHIEFVNIAEPPAAGEGDARSDVALPDGLDRCDALARFHVQRADGKVLSGAAAFAAMWREIPGWRWAGRLVALPGVVHVMEAAYRGFLVVRPAMQRAAGWFDRRSDSRQAT